MKHLFDLRVCGPFVVALVCWLPRALPTAAAPPPPRGAAVPLPTLHGLPDQAGPRTLEIDAGRSAVRFLVATGRGELLVECSAIAGSLHFGKTRGEGELELQLDLAALQPVGGKSLPADLVDVLGVQRGDEVVYRAELVATTTCDLPGVTGLTWLGTLRFGHRVVRQPMQTWLCALPGQPLRLQGHGTVSGADYGLRRHTLFGLYEEPHDVTLGFDLACRRR